MSMKKPSHMLVSGLLIINSLNASADAIGAIQAVDNALRATSLIDIIAKAKSTGLDEAQINTIPQIVIEADCSDCQISNATKYLLLSSYIETAKANQINIGSHQVKFKIPKYIARNSFVRSVLGVLSGPDYVAGQFENDPQVLSRFSISHEMGIHEITQQLGEDLVKHQIRQNIQRVEK
jgi:hypothetical protein